MTYILLLFCLFIATTWAQCDSPLLGPDNEYGPDGTEEDSTASNLDYCSALLDGEKICCESSTITGFSTIIADQIGNITAFIAERDRYFKEQSNNAGTVLTKLESLEIKLGSINATYPDIYPGFTARFGTIYNGMVEDKDDIENFKVLFRAFSEERKKCFDTLTNFYANALCLACSADYEDHGVTGTSDAPFINWGPSACGRMAEQCYQYFRYSERMNDILTFIASEARLDFITQKVDNALETGLATEFLGGSIPDTVITNLNDGWEAPTTFPPDNCNSPSRCNWICENMLHNGTLDTEVMSLGGLNATYVDENAVVEEEEEEEEDDRRRRLQDQAIFSPGEFDAGIEVDYEQDPANILSGNLMAAGYLSYFVVLYMLIN